MQRKRLKPLSGSSHLCMDREGNEKSVSLSQTNRKSTEVILKSRKFWTFILKRNVGSLDLITLFCRIILIFCHFNTRLKN